LHYRLLVYYGRDMKRIANHRPWRLACAGLAAAGALLGGCTTYKPLDQGAAVPWAAASAGPSRGDQVRSSSGTVRVGGRSVGNGAIATTVLAGAPADPGGETIHRVQRGETLVGIARRHRVALGDLAAANRLRPPYTIHVGQELRVPGTGAARPAVAEVREPSAPQRYVVQRGEGLAAIARRHDVPMRALAEANRIEPPYTLHVGQELRIPERDTTTVARAPVPATPGSPPALSGEGFIWPVQGRVISRFGADDRGEQHAGIAIAARKGTPVRAAENGLVVYAGDGIRGYGRMVLLRHDGEYVSTYAHNASILVNVGDVVARGQVIARVGDTGGVGEPQLHFELRKGRQPLDPEVVLVAEPTTLASSEQR
jgi:murein DD-endopeptidase MepM/ murein hydrolase activator NlpD